MRRGYFAILIAFCFSLSCKNPFETRKPSEPERNRQGQWEFPSTPDLAIQNLYWAYNERIISNYISCLADSYKFVASVADSALYPDIFTDWGLDKELSSTRALFALDTLFLALSPDPSRQDIINPTKATVYRRYIIIAEPSQTAPTDSPAEGTAIFYLSRDDSGKWLIYLQKDEPEQNSWAQLKREFL